jgi:hypothetical protein
MHKTPNFTPHRSSSALATLRDLKAWMVENACDFLSYQIDSAIIHEGFILAPVGSSFNWIYTERGIETVQKRFKSEAEAVSYAYEQIRGDGWACSHLIGFLREKTQLQALKLALQDRSIDYFEDAIPYGGKDDMRYRVFVHNACAAAVADLKEKYGGGA